SENKSKINREEKNARRTLGRKLVQFLLLLPCSRVLLRHGCARQRGNWRAMADHKQKRRTVNPFKRKTVHQKRDNAEISFGDLPGLGYLHFDEELKPTPSPAPIPVPTPPPPAKLDAGGRGRAGGGRSSVHVRVVRCVARAQALWDFSPAVAGEVGAPA